MLIKGCRFPPPPFILVRPRPSATLHRLLIHYLINRFKKINFQTTRGSVALMCRACVFFQRPCKNWAFTYRAPPWLRRLELRVTVQYIHKNKNDVHFPWLLSDSDWICQAVMLSLWFKVLSVGQHHTSVWVLSPLLETFMRHTHPWSYFHFTKTAERDLLLKKFIELYGERKVGPVGRIQPSEGFNDVALEMVLIDVKCICFD